MSEIGKQGCHEEASRSYDDVEAMMVILGDDTLSEYGRAEVDRKGERLQATVGVV